MNPKKVKKNLHISRNYPCSNQTSRTNYNKKFISINLNPNKTISFSERTNNRRSSVCLPKNNTLQLFLNRTKLFKLTTKQTQKQIINFHNIDSSNYNDDIYSGSSSIECRTNNQKSVIQISNSVKSIKEKWDNSDFNQTQSLTTETENQSVRRHKKTRQKYISEKNKSKKHEESFLLHLSKISENSLLDLSSKSIIKKTLIHSRTLNHESCKFSHKRQYKLKTIYFKKLQTFQNVKVQSTSRNNSLSHLNDSSFLVLSDLDNKSFQENVLEKLNLFLSKIEINIKTKLNHLETLSNSLKTKYLNNSFHHIITYDSIKQHSPKEEVKFNLNENYNFYKQSFFNKDLISIPMEYTKVLFSLLLFRKQDTKVKLIKHFTINMIFPMYFYLDIYNLIFNKNVFENSENNHCNNIGVETQLLNRAHTISFKPSDIFILNDNKDLRRIISLPHKLELHYWNTDDHNYEIYRKYCNDFLFRDYSYYIIPCVKNIVFNTDFVYLSGYDSNNLKMNGFTTRKVSLKNKGIKSFNKGITLSNKNNFKNLSRPESDSQNTNYNFLKLKANSNYFLRNKSAIQNEHQKRTSTKLNETMQINESYHNKAKQKHTFKDKLTITQQAFFHIKDRNFIQFKNIFIKNKLSPNLKDKDGNSLLSLAVKTNYIPLVKYLLNAGANVNSQNLKGNTPLHFALSYHDYNIADLLISNGANEKIVNNQGSTPWQCLDINYSII